MQAGRFSQGSPLILPTSSVTLQWVISWVGEEGALYKISLLIPSLPCHPCAMMPGGCAVMYLRRNDFMCTESISAKDTHTHTHTHTQVDLPNGCWRRPPPAMYDNLVYKVSVWVSPLCFILAETSTRNPLAVSQCKLQPDSLPFKLEVLKQCQLKELQICHALPPAWCSFIRISPPHWYLGNK